MKDAIHRTMRPATTFRARVALRATDTQQQRAENMVTLMGATTGDPSLIAQHVAVIRDTLMAYQEIDSAAR